MSDSAAPANATDKGVHSKAGLWAVTIGSIGVVYPSLRRKSGTNFACFRPAAVGNVRRGDAWRFTWTGAETPQIERGTPAAKRRGRLPRG